MGLKQYNELEMRCVAFYFIIQTPRYCQKRTAEQIGCVCASHPAVPGSILGILKLFKSKNEMFRDLSTAALLREWVVQKAKYLINPI